MGESEKKESDWGRSNEGAPSPGSPPVLTHLGLKKSFVYVAVTTSSKQVLLRQIQRKRGHVGRERQCAKQDARTQLPDLHSGTAAGTM